MKSLSQFTYVTVGTLVTLRTALAQNMLDIQEPIDDVFKPTGEQDPVVFIQSFIGGLLSFLGIIMIGMTLWGGWKILTSGSKDEGKEAGKKIILNAVIGMVVIFFAWTITSLVFSILTGNGKV